MAALLALAACMTAAAATPPRHVVRDPYYGDSLFYFFQQHYFSAVTDLMVSQHFERLPHHVDEAELMRGGLYLSYGMHREAGDIFAKLIEKSAKPAVRDRAWYYLAKIRYQRDLPGPAEEALSHVGSQLPAELEEDRVLLQANLLMARGAYADAARVLAGLANNPKASVYVRYNLGVALIKSGQVEQGTALLDQIGRAPAEESEEMLSLRDKANVALGFTALQNNDPDHATTYLERVRLTGMLANKALLGFGWAAATRKQPKQALVPWLELSKRTTTDAAVLEAKLAVPYAMGELGAYSQSLELYNDAISVFDRERAKLDESIAAIHHGKLVEGLLKRNPGEEEMSWFRNIDQLPQLPHAEHLVPVLARHDFQEAFKNYRDLLFLSKNLDQWHDKLGVYNDMLATRRQAFADRLPKVRAEEGASGLNGLDQRRDELARELTWAEAHSNVYAFTDPQEQKLAERLTRVQELLRRAGDDPQFAEERERYRMVAGALTWQLTQEYPARLWDAKKRLLELDTELGQAHSRDTALTQAQLEEPAHFEQFSNRIAQLDYRIRVLQPHVAALIHAQDRYLQGLAVAELEHQKEQLATYATQARFAVARIYDRANLGKAGDAGDSGEATQRR
jgi:Tetratricopeptide repeat